MPGVDLDALRQLQPETGDPFTYRLGGRTFTAVRHAPTVQLAKAAEKLRGADAVQSVVQMVGVIFTLTVESQHKALRKVLLSTRDPITPDIVTVLFWALTEHFTADVAVGETAAPVEEKPMERYDRMVREGARRSDGEWADIIDFANRHGGQVVMPDG